MTPTEKAAAAYSAAYERYHGYKPILRVSGSWVEIRDHADGFASRYQKAKLEKMTRNLNGRLPKSHTGPDAIMKTCPFDGPIGDEPAYNEHCPVCGACGDQECRRAPQAATSKAPPEDSTGRH